VIGAEALAQLAERLGHALHQPVELGSGSAAEGPVLRILVDAMVPEVRWRPEPSPGSARAPVAWMFRLVLKGEAEGVLAGTRLVEEAATEIDACPVLEGAGWRAELVLDADLEIVRGLGPAVAVRMRVMAA
jgi:hypothetical protein